MTSVMMRGKKKKGKKNVKKAIERRTEITKEKTRLRKKRNVTRSGKKDRLILIVMWRV
jgi:hypothetical protein